MPPAPRSWRPSTRPALDELEAGFDEQLLRERIADLHGRPLRWVVVGERRAREDRRPADAVAAGRRAEQHDEVAGAGRGGQGQPALLHQPDGHDVDERVALVRRIEDELAADGRDADAVAVARRRRGRRHRPGAASERPRRRRSGAHRGPRSAARPS